VKQVDISRVLPRISQGCLRLLVLLLVVDGWESLINNWKDTFHNCFSYIHALTYLNFELLRRLLVFVCDD